MFYEVIEQAEDKKWGGISSTNVVATDYTRSLKRAENFEGFLDEKEARRAKMLKKWRGVASRYTAHEVSSYRLAFQAFCDMTGKEFVQVHRQDEAILEILGSICYSYPLAILVCKFFEGGFDYPLPEVILRFQREMEDEGIYGPG